jgi:hypothetical protein
MNDTKIELTLGLINNVLGYLATRPYQEVFPLIQEVQAQAMPQVPMPKSTVEAGLTD